MGQMSCGAVAAYMIQLGKALAPFWWQQSQELPYFSCHFRRLHHVAMDELLP